MRVVGGFFFSSVEILTKAHLILFNQLLLYFIIIFHI